MHSINEDGNLEKFSFLHDVELKWIEEWYPGVKKLTLIEQFEKLNYKSLHYFQFEIAKRRQEDSFEENDDGEIIGGNL